MERIITVALSITAALLIFGLGFLVGAGQGTELIRQQAVDEGYAVRDPEFRWRRSEELSRTRRSKPGD